MKFYKLSLLCALGLFSCANNDIDDTSKNVLVNMSIEQMIDDTYGINTRFATETNGTSASPSLFYEGGDDFGIIPTTALEDGSSQIRYVVQLPAGTKATSVTLFAGAWDTKPGYTYVGYLPYSLENQDPTKIPVSYLGQRQSSNNNSDHLSKAFLMASEPAGAKADGSFGFTIKKMGGVLRFAITVPEAGTFTKMEFTSSKADQFGVTGTLDLTDMSDANNPQPYTATKKTNIMSLDLDNISVAAGDLLTLFLSIPTPTDLTGNTFTVTLYSSTGYKFIYTSDLPSVATKLRARNKGTSIVLPEAGHAFTVEEDNSLGTLTGTVQ
ncbi:MAG: hypothetical protein MJZ83_09420 [Bacteroidaceae bacterium]|nr:hypothetical protein [Bacteroidaceae bacterium]